MHVTSNPTRIKNVGKFLKQLLDATQKKQMNPDRHTHTHTHIHTKKISKMLDVTLDFLLNCNGLSHFIGILKDFRMGILCSLCSKGRHIGKILVGFQSFKFLHESYVPNNGI